MSDIYHETNVERLARMSRGRGEVVEPMRVREEQNRRERNEVLGRVCGYLTEKPEEGLIIKRRNDGGYELGIKLGGEGEGERWLRVQNTSLLDQIFWDNQIYRNHLEGFLKRREEE